MNKTQALPQVPASFNPPPLGWIKVKQGDTIQWGDYWEQDKAFANSSVDNEYTIDGPLWRYIGIVKKEQPDTSTLEGKIAVMEAFKEGKRIQFFNRISKEWKEIKTISWDWNTYDYRIHPDDINPPPSWDDRTFNAWFESVQHWERLSSGNRRKDEGLGTKNCALCQQFYANPGCSGCPVAARTKQSMCFGSPYHETTDVYVIKGPDSTEFKSAAKEELSFLLSLLPEDMKERYENEKLSKAIHVEIIKRQEQKKEPQYRVWTPEEVPVGCLLRWKVRRDFSSKFVLSSFVNKLVYVFFDGKFYQYDLQTLLDVTEHSTDNGVTWKPCGKEIV